MSMVLCAALTMRAQLSTPTREVVRTGQPSRTRARQQSGRYHWSATPSTRLACQSPQHAAASGLARKPSEGQASCPPERSETELAGLPELRRRRNGVGSATTRRSRKGWAAT
jgi:hypothetical protein